MGQWFNGSMVRFSVSYILQQSTLSSGMKPRKQVGSDWARKQETGNLSCAMASALFCNARDVGLNPTLDTICHFHHPSEQYQWPFMYKYTISQIWWLLLSFPHNSSHIYIIIYRDLYLNFTSKRMTSDAARAMKEQTNTKYYYLACQATKEIQFWTAQPADRGILERWWRGGSREQQKVVRHCLTQGQAAGRFLWRRESYIGAVGLCNVCWLPDLRVFFLFVCV